ncbi:MAG: primosomal protein N' [Rhizobiaceae bacterium]|nr:primosomal protein N' [Rhizobiaceae bacterium]
MTKTVSVLLPIPAERAYTYAIGPEMTLAPGDIVLVPLGPRQVFGVVWDTQTDDIAASKLKQVIAKSDCPPLRATMRRFIEWVADYTISPPGMVLRMVLRTPAAYDPPSPQEGLRFSGVEPERMTSARIKVLELVREEFVWTKSGLAHAAGVSTSVIEGLIKQGVFDRIEIPPQPIVTKPEPGFAAPELSDKQRAAANELVDCVKSDTNPVSLLDGVTGSGKTEIYFEAMAEVFKNGKQVLVLLPEIALTSGFLERFEKRFGSKPAQWHSDITPKMREKIWRQVATGEVQVVVGARSALYLPFSDLGLIVVDEEHEAAFKQEDRVYYNARDMAVVRGSIAKAPVILSSATPSIESRVNANLGRYQYIRLEERYKQAAMPDLRVIDMRKNPPARGKFISPVLVREISAALERGEQSLIFLNRRGYAPLTLCRVCGHRFQCDDCSAWLVEHRFRGQLVCHHCGHNEPVPEACPGCGTLDHLVACGPGVERLGEEMLELFGDKRIMVLSSDMAGGAKRMRLELDAIAKGEADIIIGTQLVAKGHNFPLMTCVGVVDADLGLSNGDPRATERTFQLLSQVTGRAGRSGRKSIGLIQTYQPEHPVIEAIISGEREQFYEREIAARKSAGLPPFSRLASMVISSADRKKAQSHATAVRLAAKPQSEILVLGPAEAPIARIRGRYRFRLLFRAEKANTLHTYIRQVLARSPRLRGDLRLQVDVDPQSFL